MIFVTKEPIEKGWSGDKKYRVTDPQGTPYLLRISPAEAYSRKLSQFRRMEQLAKLDIPMCLPIDFGLCEDGVYIVQSWISGQDAIRRMPTLPEKQQYRYGLDAGRILRKIHSLPAPDDLEDWSAFFSRKIDRKLQMYADCPLKYDVDQPFLSYIASHRHLLANRPQTYQHGDYHIGNMMIDDRGILTVIDFDKDDFGDPWEEFNRIVWSAQNSPAFASGMVDGYFGGCVPQNFWDLLALYLCSNTLSSLPWAIPFGDEEITVMRNQSREILSWYDHFRTTVPSWYHPFP